MTLVSCYVCRDGFDRLGRDRAGYDAAGWDKYGYDKEGYSKVCNKYVSRSQCPASVEALLAVNALQNPQLADSSVHLWCGELGCAVMPQVNTSCTHILH